MLKYVLYLVIYNSGDIPEYKNLDYFYDLNSCHIAENKLKEHLLYDSSLFQGHEYAKTLCTEGYGT